MAAPESRDRRRISVELPESLVTRLDALKDEWGLRARGDCLTRLLEEIFKSDEGLEDDPSLAETQQDPIEDADAPGGIGENAEQDK